MDDELSSVQHFADARLAVLNGSSPDDAARLLVASMTAEERLWCLDGDAPTWAGLHFLVDDGYHRAPFGAAQVERIGLAGIAFADGPRGAVIGNSTCFPVSMARGATWDPALEERVGEAIGRELRAQGANLTGAVCVNLLRHPAWGRAQETYGEDPFHVGELGAALTRGLQRHVLACVKHLACNSMENARFSVDIEIDEVALHEVYLPHFRRIVDEGVASVMTAYNSVNGEWCGESPTLIRKILRGEWGFEGFVISDWIFGLRDAGTSIAAGLDIEMPYRMIRAQHLSDALQRGEASWADVDAAVTRFIATLLRFDTILSMAPPPMEVVGSAEHRALAREVAGRSVVLLRNERTAGTALLPLQAGVTSVAVIGRFADAVNLGDGGSSDVWDLHCRTIFDGLKEFAGTVTHDDGSDLRRAAQAATGAHVAVVVVGYSYADEGEFIGATDPSLPAMFPTADEADVVERFERSLSTLAPTIKPERLQSRPRGFSTGGDRSSLRLPDADVALIRSVAAANPHTIVVMQAGSAVVTTEWIDAVPAVLQAWYGGAEAGPGLADVLFGAVNPSGRLPFSVPANEADLPEFDREATSFGYNRWHGWRYLARNATAPAFAFGFGLSYTSFEIDSVSLVHTTDTITVRGVVANTGDRDGADVIQIYAELPDPDAPPRLVGFERIEVPAGANAGFEVAVPVHRLATRDADRHEWRDAAGPHRIRIARCAVDPGAHTLDIHL